MLHPECSDRSRPVSAGLARAVVNAIVIFAVVGVSPAVKLENL